jgi:hypothetical protein
VKFRVVPVIALVGVVGGTLVAVSQTSSLTKKTIARPAASSVVPGTVPPRSAGSGQGPTTSTTPSAPGRLPALPPPSTGVQGATPTPIERPSTVEPSVPSVSCSAVSHDLQAAVTGFGPYVGMHTMQDIVSLRSSTPCRLSGYPTLTFSGATTLRTTQQDGATLGSPRMPAVVVVGTQYQASFLLQFSSSGSGSSSCPVATALSMSIPGSHVHIPISIAPMSRAQSRWSPCGHTVAVSPFEQGNGPGDYT